MGANADTAPPPPPPAPPPAKPVPVALENKNTIDSASVVITHLWQEFHWKAPTNKYLGKTDDDKKVAENLDANGALLAKKTLNAAFHEWAMATVEIEVPADQKVYMKWWLEDAKGNQIAEHPDFSKKNYDANAAAAKVKKAHYAWQFDGRKLISSGDRRVFMRDEECWSHIEVKSVPGRVIPLGQKQYAYLKVEGEPYKIFIMGVPKSDAEMELEKTNHGNGRWLHSDGAKLATDCWIKVYRGVSGDDAYMVFLGHGATEATGYGTETAGGVVKNGAIATPHDVDHRCWIRHRHWSFGGDVSLCEIANVAPKSGEEWLLTLNIRNDSSGNPLPPANNPYCDTRTNQPYKDGVQGHRSFNQGGLFLIDDASTGCTTIVDLSNGSRAKPAGELGDVRCIKASYGTYYGGDPSDASHKDKIWGPPLDASRPGTFYNKQNKRTAAADALLADDYSKPLVHVPRDPADATHDDEPLHMQPTFQNGMFGGFLGHEIANTGNIADEPDAATNDDPKLKMRCRLVNAPEVSKAWQYHRLVCFGHVPKLVGAKVTIDLWVPRIFQRLWNGHSRNVMVRDADKGLTNECEYAWFFEQRNADGTTVNRGWIGKKPAAGKDFVTIDEIGKVTKENLAKPTFDSAAAKAAGAQMFSVFNYRVKLAPQPAAGTSVWEPLTARIDQFSDLANPARLSDEQIVTVGGIQFLQGRSEVMLPFI
jgi:hypothetical protein